MSTDRPKRETMTIEEAAVSNMWEIAAIVEVLERKDLRQEIPRCVIRTESQRPACYTAPEYARHSTSAFDPKRSFAV